MQNLPILFDGVRGRCWAARRPVSTIADGNVARHRVPGRVWHPPGCRRAAAVLRSGSSPRL